MKYSVDVKFKNSVRKYTYLVTKEQYDKISIGSHVVVDSPSQGYTVVEVGARCKSSTTVATKYIVDIVDDAKHKERIIDVTALNKKICVLEDVIEAQEAEITRLKNYNENMKKSCYAIMYGGRGYF